MQSAEVVSLWEAWARWLNGNKIEDLTMWGVRMLWWARIGKLLEFAGGLVVVLDLVGPERLRKLSERTRQTRTRLRQTPPTKAVGERANAKTHANTLLLTTGGSKWEPPRPVSLREAEQRGIAVSSPWMSCVAFLAGTLSAGLWIYYNDAGTWFGALVLPLLIGCLTAWVLLWVLPLVVYLGAALALVAAQHLMLLSAMVFADRPGHPTRWAAFLLVIVGFHFDLLAS